MSAREKVLDAAAALAAREGVTALGVDRVVREAGVSKGSFFYHFATKEEMVAALLDHVADRCMREIDEATQGGASFIDAFIAMIVRQLEQSGELIAVLVAAVALDPSRRVTLTERSRAWRTRVIREGGVSPSKADLLLLAIDGAMIGAILYEHEGRRERAQTAEAALRSIIRG